MKKILLFVSFVFSCACMVFAGNPIKVTSGKSWLKNLMKETAAVYVEFDWSNAKFDNEKAVIEDFQDDYDYIVESCASNFVEGFNDKAKSLKVQLTEEGASYKLIVTITNIDTYFSVMSIIPGHKANLWCKLKCVSYTTGETVYEAEAEEVEGGRDSVRKDCFAKAFTELGTAVAKLK